jgi:molecular chaperone GrpE
VTERPTGEEREETGPVVHDRRRIDPVTGALREPAATPAPAAGPAEEAAPVSVPAPSEGTAPTAEGEDNHLVEDVADELSRQIAERTADLQRLQAEYANYRRRVERDRELIRETAVANVLTNLLPVLDDIGRARDHGELEGGFKSVGESLEAIVSSLGLRSFGKAGEAFDPTVHEAMTHTVSADVTETTCVEVYQPGYRIGDRVVRPARVAVADPEG